MRQDDQKPEVGRAWDTPSGRRPSLDEAAYALHQRLSAEGNQASLGDQIMALLGHRPFLSSRPEHRLSRQELVERIAHMLTAVSALLPQPVPNQDEVLQIAEATADNPEALGTLFDVCEAVMPAVYPFLP